MTDDPIFPCPSCGIGELDPPGICDECGLVLGIGFNERTGENEIVEMGHISEFETELAAQEDDLQI